MVIFTALDPTVLDAAYLCNETHRRELEQYLKAIEENGLIFVDPNDIILSEIRSRAGTLSLPHTQRIQIRLTELIKTKQRVITCNRDQCFNITPISIPEMMYQLALKVPLDAVVVSEDTMNTLIRNGVSEPRIIRIQDYSSTQVEDSRRRYLAALPPINELSGRDVQDIFRRSVKYSKTLRIYDKQLGQCTNLARFLRSIEFILDIWISDGYFNQQKFEIITLRKKGYDSPENDEAHRTLSEKVVKPLSDRYSVPINLLVKKASPPRAPAADFHPRHLQSDYAVLLVERGFDFLKTDGTFHTCPIALRDADRNHLNRYYNLPNLQQPTP